MEFKFFLVLAVLGVASGFTIPDEKTTDFHSSYTETGKSSSPTRFTMPDEGEGTVRDKRHLYKKWKKGGEAVIVNREYEHGYVENRPGREVHHIHHYDYARPPTYVQQSPNREYHHYHGYNEGGYGYTNPGYYSNGYSEGYATSGGSYVSKPGYGNGGYSQQPPSGPTNANPAATGHNAVDRGQGAAAVNNIAIIHARAGTHSGSGSGLEESKTLSDPSTIDFEALSNEVLGLH